jgi:glycosyltransferase involved in cell wall biosynthesis
MKGCDIDCYEIGPRDELSQRFTLLDGVRLINFDTGWRWNRWYSNHHLSALLTGMASRAWGRRRLSSTLLEEHRHQPYDAIYQFSTIEVFGLRRHLAELPPIITHPSTHMAGELRWVRSERNLAAKCAPLWKRVLIENFLAIRVRRQRRDIHLAARVAAISRRFRDDLIRDYRVQPERLTVVPNPIDLDELRPLPRADRAKPWRVAFIGRMSSRKGVEMVVKLSHALVDLEGDVILDLIGDHTLWSDYRPLLVGLEPRIAHYHGRMARQELISFLGQADVLVQPAKYEPFGLTAGEALALGVPVVASDAVGATEDVSAECCSVVPAGDITALERAVRHVLDRLRNGEGAVLAQKARAEAERLFSQETVATLAFETVIAATGKISGSQAQ